MAPQAKLDDISKAQTRYLVIQRKVDRDWNRQEESQSDRSDKHSDENADDGGTSLSTDSSKESLRLKMYSVQFFASKRSALDDVSFRFFRDGMGSPDLMGSMVLPEPPTLHADDDFGTVFDQLSASTPPQDASSTSSSSCSPTAAPSSSSPRFISVPTLICLANTVSEFEKTYSLVQYNWYWYCSMLFYSLRRYSGANIVLRGKKGTTTVGPEESPSAAKEKFKLNNLKLAPGRMGPVEVVYPPSDETINTILSSWAECQAKMETDVRKSRFILFVFSADLN
jgi:hypothetical protein